MPFILQKYSTQKGQKIQIFLLRNRHKSPYISQKSLSKGRIFNPNMKPFTYNDVIETDFIYVVEFEGSTRGLKPLFQAPNFALFDKPTNLMVHPSSKNTKYCLLDEVRFHFGMNSNLVHRIDAETSGLVLVAKDKEHEVSLKDMFLEKKYKKRYLAIVEKELKEEMKIDSPLKKEGKNIGVRMTTSFKGDEKAKDALTYVKPLFYNKDRDLTLVEVSPITGRQHQIRVHLHSIGHRIYGDPIYGIDDETADAYLDKTLDEQKRIKITGSNRLWLHANYLEFDYENVIYKINSKNKDIYEEMHKLD